jgi:hypothetical protein
VTNSPAIAALTAAFEATFPRDGWAAGVDAPVAVISWPSVPLEIVRAAGLHPHVIRGAATPTPAADAHLEPGAFPNRLHQLVEAAITGRLSEVACLIIPRTSDPDYKCFLYLRELVRRGVVRRLPPVLLFDLLQSHGSEVHEYNAGRVRELYETLAASTGRRPSLDAVRQQITETNTARAARGRLLALRSETPHVTGTQALPLVGAFWQMAADDYAALATAAAATLASRSPLAGARVLLAGAPTDDTALHAAIESHGAIVVAETSPWGSGAMGRAVDSRVDPMFAVADTYRLDAIGPRLPVDVLRRWSLRVLNVDAVVVSLPAEDMVFGWDYPALRDGVASRGIPHVVLRGDNHEVLADASRSRLASLLAAVPQREARGA